jgi:dihydroflavonol-4-reductase
VTRANRAFLTGGSGLVGGHLLARLVESGWAVDAVVRSSVAAEKVTALGGVAVHGDLLDPVGLAALMRGADTVFHVAGINDTCPKDPGSMDQVNIEGTRSVVAAAGASDIRRVVYTSSAATIGESAGDVGTETTVHSGTFLSPYARSKYLAEIAAFTEAESHGVDLVAVNPSSVQGPGRATGSAGILIQILNAKRPVLVDTAVSVVDIEDCTTGHIAASMRGEPGRRYLLSAQSVTVGEAVVAMVGVLGHPIRPRWVPSPIVRAVGLPLTWVAGKTRPDAGICPALVRTLLHGHRFDASRATDELGVVFRPATETLGRTAEWLIAQGYVAERGSRMRG